MFREITITKKEDGRYTRRWYEDDPMDLYVWFDDEGAIARFQLTYDKPNFEKAIDWKRDRGFVHSRIDYGPGPGGRPGTPLMIYGGVFDKLRIVAEFEKRAVEIDARVQAFILNTLRRYRDPAAVRRLKKILTTVGVVLAGALVAWRLWK